MLDRRRKRPELHTLKKIEQMARGGKDITRTCSVLPRREKGQLRAWTSTRSCATSFSATTTRPGARAFAVVVKLSQGP